MTKLPRLLSEIRGWAHMSGQKIPLAPEKTEDRKFSCTKHPELFKNYSEICELIEAKGGNYFPCLRTAVKDGIVAIDIDCHNGKKPEEAKEQFEEMSSILYSELGDRYTSISETTIFKYLKIIAGLGRYHPVVDFFEQLVTPSTDVQDSLDRLYEILGVTDGFEKTLIAKWLLQCVAMVFNTDQQRPYGADGILVLQGAQGIGKTSFAEALGMNEPGFVNVGIRLNENDKDTFRRAVTCWIAELGELDETFKKSDIEMLKAFITQPRDMYRLPYDRSDLKYNRRSSFIATCNEPEFLVDTTGNRRFWSVHVDKIDLDALRAYDFKELWAGIYELWRIEGKQSFRLSREEQKILNERNRVFEKPVKAETEIRDILAYTKDNDSFKYSWVTATQFMNDYPELRNHSYRSQDIGRALKKFTLEEKSEHNVIYRYLPMPKSQWV